ncbi:MAG: FHA domain-containing protein [Candidatus Azobacteroides sp.]|nr:FHA domain-containing protein [Candidatus Azobacteroides sp.]
MGNARTVITGSNSDNEKKTVYNQPTGVPVYERTDGRKRTPGTVAGNDNPYWEVQQESVKNKPLVGFLISVSRTPEGEFWPLRLGENTIGSASDCSILLNEEKVSEKHATLIIQINEEENFQLNVWITGLNATNGTYLNKKLIPPQTAISCNNNDKIKIGNYELLLLLFDANKHGMKSADSFKLKYDYGGDNFSYGGAERFSPDPKSTRF